MHVTSTAARALGLLLGALSIASLSAPAAASRSTAPRAKVLILGVYHFGNPNQDYVKTDVDDHLSAKRQKEIDEVVERLAAFKPTKIALEAVDGTSAVPKNYEQYLAGTYTLTANERDQLGFKLAKRAGLKRVEAVDVVQDMDFDALLGAAKASNDRVFLGEFESAMATFQTMTDRVRSQTVAQALADANSAAMVERTRGLYLAMARVSSGPGKYEGADVLAGWYQRNFRIFANVARLATSPEDRVVVIYGSGHLASLRELVAAAPNLELVDAGTYLGR